MKCAPNISKKADKTDAVAGF